MLTLTTSIFIKVHTFSLPNHNKTNLGNPNLTKPYPAKPCSIITKLYWNKLFWIPTPAKLLTIPSCEPLVVIILCGPPVLAWPVLPENWANIYQTLQCLADSFLVSCTTPPSHTSVDNLWHPWWRGSSYNTRPASRNMFRQCGSESHTYPTPFAYCLVVFA